MPVCLTFHWYPLTCFYSRLKPIVCNVSLKKGATEPFFSFIDCVMAHGEWIISQFSKIKVGPSSRCKDSLFYDSFFTYLCGGSAKRDIYGINHYITIEVDNAKRDSAMQQMEVFCMGRQRFCLKSKKRITCRIVRMDACAWRCTFQARWLDLHVTFLGTLSVKVHWR